MEDREPPMMAPSAMPLHASIAVRLGSRAMMAEYSWTWLRRFRG
jgi:hypothetical protein